MEKDCFNVKIANHVSTDGDNVLTEVRIGDDVMTFSADVIRRDNGVRTVSCCVVERGDDGRVVTGRCYDIEKLMVIDGKYGLLDDLDGTYARYIIRCIGRRMEPSVMSIYAMLLVSKPFAISAAIGGDVEYDMYGIRMRFTRNNSRYRVEMSRDGYSVTLQECGYADIAKEAYDKFLSGKAEIKEAIMRIAEEAGRLESRIREIETRIETAYKPGTPYTEKVAGLADMQRYHLNGYLRTLRERVRLLEEDIC